MSRTERATDKAQDIVRFFANDLAKLRELHGNPSFERMHNAIRHNARAAGSKNTFHRMISNPDRIYEPEFVRGFVLALGLEDHEADVWEQRRAQAMREYQHRDSAAASAPPERTPAQPWLARRRLAIFATAAVIIIAAVIAAFLGVGGPSDSHNNARIISSRLPANVALMQPRDGADPKDSGCSLDPSTVTLDSAEVDYEGHPAGLDELRYSPHCGVAWARFTPFPAARIPADAIIHVDVFRPGSHNLEESFQAPYVGAPVYGNVMRSTVECVYASVAIEVAGKESPESRTWCFRGKTPEENVASSGR
jgi:hypothetical protein